MLKETKKIIKNKDKNKKGKIKNKIMKGNDLRKSFDLDIYQDGDFQTSSKILDSKILEEGNYQTSPKNVNPRITEEHFQAFLVNSIPVNCEEGSNQTSLRCCGRDGTDLRIPG